MSYPKFDSTKEVCPEKMIVEVLEVLKGKNSSKLITVLGYDKSVNNNLACLQFYSIGRYYILGLDNFKLIAAGNHSLEYNEGIVKGNITNEPTREYLKKFQKIFDRLQKLKSFGRNSQCKATYSTSQWTINRLRKLSLLNKKHNSIMDCTLDEYA
jgi:hypothetical protein